MPVPLGCNKLLRAGSTGLAIPARRGLFGVHSTEIAWCAVLVALRSWLFLLDMAHLGFTVQKLSGLLTLF